MSHSNISLRTCEEQSYLPGLGEGPFHPVPRLTLCTSALASLNPGPGKQLSPPSSFCLPHAPAQAILCILGLWDWLPEDSCLPWPLAQTILNTEVEPELQGSRLQPNLTQKLHRGQMINTLFCRVNATCMGPRALGLVGICPSKPSSVQSSHTCVLLCTSVCTRVCVGGCGGSCL